MLFINYESCISLGGVLRLSLAHISISIVLTPQPLFQFILIFVFIFPNLFDAWIITSKYRPRHRIIE